MGALAEYIVRIRNRGGFRRPDRAAGVTTERGGPCGGVRESLRKDWGTTAEADLAGGNHAGLVGIAASAWNWRWTVLGGICGTGSSRLINQSRIIRNFIFSIARLPRVLNPASFWIVDFADKAVGIGNSGVRSDIGSVVEIECLPIWQSDLRNYRLRIVDARDCRATAVLAVWP